jgi:ubiquinone/menaquinone biosynthesis C-methylase UbiE
MTASARKTTMPKNPSKKTDHYDDPAFDYSKYWEGREYEHEAEKMAIGRLLDGMHFKTAVDIGGGYGRLSLFLKKYADKVTLTEPSAQQLQLANKYLKDAPDIGRQLLPAHRLAFQDGSIDLAIMIRVLHHLPDPTAEFAELSRVLHKDGYAVLEVANYMHLRNRVRHIVHRKRFPVGPVDISSNASDQTPFVNHNPKTIRKQLAHEGLMVERILSVSNLRSGRLKRLMPKSIMLAIEGILQPTLAKGYFGPSVFFLVRKVK